MKTEIKKNHRLPIQTAALFSDPYEWCILDWVYWRTNTQTDRTWICRMNPIAENTPVKRLQTINKTLERLCQMGIGFSKIPFGVPQRRNQKGQTLKVEATQSYQYIFDAAAFDSWLAESGKTLTESGKRVLTETVRGLAESGKCTLPKTVSKNIDKKNEVKEGTKKEEDKRIKSNIECTGTSGGSLAGSLQGSPVRSKVEQNTENFRNSILSIQQRTVAASVLSCGSPSSSTFDSGSLIHSRSGTTHCLQIRETIQTSPSAAHATVPPLDLEKQLAEEYALYKKKEKEKGTDLESILEASRRKNGALPEVVGGRFVIPNSPEFDNPYLK